MGGSLKPVGSVVFRPVNGATIANISNLEYTGFAESLPNLGDLATSSLVPQNPVASILGEASQLAGQLGINLGIDAQFVESLQEQFTGLSAQEVSLVMNTYIDDTYGVGAVAGSVFPGGIPNPVNGKTAWTDYRLLDSDAHPALHAMLLERSLQKAIGSNHDFSSVYPDPAPIDLTEIFGQEGGTPKGSTNGYVSYTTRPDGNTFVLQVVNLDGVEKYTTFVVSPTGLVLEAETFLSTPNRAHDIHVSTPTIPPELRWVKPTTDPIDDGNNNNPDGDDDDEDDVDDDTVTTTPPPDDPVDPMTFQPPTVYVPPTPPTDWSEDGWTDPDGFGVGPVILDLDGDGVEVAFGEGIYFDMDDDGFLEQTSWAAADDGFLVIDLNADGTRGVGDDVIDQRFDLVLSSLGQTGGHRRASTVAPPRRQQRRQTDRRRHHLE